MKTSIEIRRAILADLDAIMRIEQGCFGEDAFSRRQLAYLIARAKGACYVAVNEDGIHGYISLVERSDIANMRIYSIAVSPAARGLGVGQALLDQAFEYARAHNIRHISLEVSVSNTPAQALYLKNGFTISSRLPAYYEDGTDAWRMKRIMAPQTKNPLH